MSSVERRRLLCAILFHFVAAVCVVWSLFVLIDRAAEEVQKGLIAWPFWTKLVVVAVGFTGGAVFMYIQCRQYLHLFSRWKAHNRIILVQNAPEKTTMMPPSPNFAISLNPQQGGVGVGGGPRENLTSQVLANIECCDPSLPGGGGTATKCYYESKDERRRASPELTPSPPPPRKKGEEEAAGRDALELNIQEVLALDMEYVKSRGGSRFGHSSKVDEKAAGRRNMFKSLPNLSASNENLLV